jgi:aldehyde dehydrogenase (NAD+)
VLVQPKVKAPLVGAIKKYLHTFYGDDPEKSPDYCRIINAKNFDRLAGFLASEPKLHGGKSDRAALYIEPTILESTLASPIMKDEIFGPLLPIIEFSDVNAAVAAVNAHAKPLALYLFTSSEAIKTQILQRTSSGGACVNDVIMHMPVPEFPFGGVGASGMGHYHGKFSFKAFTHAKGVLKKATWLDIPVRYAPYTETKSKWLRRLF